MTRPTGALNLHLLYERSARELHQADPVVPVDVHIPVLLRRYAREKNTGLPSPCLLAGSHLRRQTRAKDTRRVRRTTWLCATFRGVAAPRSTQQPHVRHIGRSTRFRLMPAVNRRDSERVPPKLLSNRKDKKLGHLSTCQRLEFVKPFPRKASLSRPQLDPRGNVSAHLMMSSPTPSSEAFATRLPQRVIS